MITLITGTPGSGKTLWTIATVKTLSEKENRPVFYSGIPELALDWQEIEAEKWFDAPPGSIVVIDECQRLFRPRGNGSAVPKYVSELETHRHKGIDLVVITQHPMLVDSNVRRLVGKHQHVARRFGLQRATVFEFESCKDQPLSKVSTSVQRYEWKYPKEVFNYYKSAEVHTHKARLPKKVYAIVAGLLLAGGTAYFFIQHQIQKINGTSEEQKKLDAMSGAIPGQKYGANIRNEPPDPYKYFKDRSPRLVGLAFSAPVYDQVTKPVTAPLPVACVSSSTKCICNSQQGTKLDMDEKTCRSIVAHGYFVDWREEKPNEKNPDVFGRAKPDEQHLGFKRPVSEQSNQPTIPASISTNIPTSQP
jgi:hypothetical protein